MIGVVYLLTRLHNSSTPKPPTKSWLLLVIVLLLQQLSAFLQLAPSMALQAVAVVVLCEPWPRCVGVKLAGPLSLHAVCCHLQPSAPLPRHALPLAQLQEAGP